MFAYTLLIHPSTSFCQHYTFKFQIQTDEKNPVHLPPLLLHHHLFLLHATHQPGLLFSKQPENVVLACPHTSHLSFLYHRQHLWIQNFTDLKTSTKKSTNKKTTQPIVLLDYLSHVGIVVKYRVVG